MRRRPLSWIIPCIPILIQGTSASALENTPPAEASFASRLELGDLSGGQDNRSIVREISLAGATVQVGLSKRRSIRSNTVVEIRGGRETSIPRASTTAWSGHVLGDVESRVFVADGPAGTFGWVDYRGRRWVISTGPHGDSNEPLLIDLQQAVEENMLSWTSFECRSPDVGPVIDRPAADGSNRRMAAGENCLSMVIAIDTDNEYLDLFGGDSAAALGYIDTLVAASDFVFERDFGGALSLGFIRIWQFSDPWSGSGTGERLQEFREFWLENEQDVVRDTAHYVSGANLGGGRAFTIGALDPMTTSYAVSGNLNGFFPYPVASFDPQNWDLFVFLHELGHLLGSPHTHSYSPQIDGCGTGDCELAYGGTIMSYCHQCSGGLGNIDISFHPRVQDRMVDFRTFDSDGDGYGDSCDGCREDAAKIEPGICDCGRVDTDADGDGVVDCLVEAFNVPSDFPTVQVAIDAAVPGATIQVAEGIWTVAGPIDPLGKELTIRGSLDEDGGLATTLSTSAASRIVRAMPAMGGTTRFENLRFEGGESGNGGGIFAFDVDLEFHGCEFAGNTADKGGAVIVLGNTTSLRFDRCRFVGNRATRDGGAIYARMSPTIDFQDCVFNSNVASESASVVGNFGSGSVDLASSVVCGNGPDPFLGDVDYLDACVSGACIDGDQDGVIDGCGGQSACGSDLNFDGRVDAGDVGLMIAGWGVVVGETPADLNEDGLVDAVDVGVMLAAWGPCGP